MTDLVKLSGSKQLLGELEETNPLVFGDIELGMLYWLQVLKRAPDLTFGDIKHIRTLKKNLQLGRKWYEKAWDGVTDVFSDVKDSIGDVANWTADKSGDATRLIFLEESESGNTMLEQALDAGAAYFSGGKSLALKDLGEVNGAAFLDNVLGFFRGSGEKVRSDIEKAGFDDPTKFDFGNLQPKHYLMIGGGILGTVLLIVLAANAFKK